MRTAAKDPPSASAAAWPTAFTVSVNESGSARTLAIR
jgi:hypothetical protein